MSILIDPNTGESIDTPKTPEIFWPTGKPHVSYSEISTWLECSFRHKLLYIDGLGTYEETPHTSFGSSIHDANEDYLNTRDMKKEIAFKRIEKAWKDNKAFSEGPFPEWSPLGFGVVDDWLQKADMILDDVPGFLDKQFPNWKCFGAEHVLYETIDGLPIKFKGYVDGVIAIEGRKAGSFVYWIIDWKTCGWGWSLDQKRDFKKQLQLIFYKNYWAKKHNIPLKDVRCAFCLLKRDAKPGHSIGFVPISVGPKMLERGLKVINNHASAVKKGFFLKNREACRFCEFEGTEHCPSSL